MKEVGAECSVISRGAKALASDASEREAKLIASFVAELHKISSNFVDHFKLEELEFVRVGGSHATLVSMKSGDIFFSTIIKKGGDVGLAILRMENLAKKLEKVTQ